jgi:hypothetical protein
MKRKTFILVVFLGLCLPILASAQVVIESFVARSDGRAVTLEWRTSKETDMAMYEVERSPVNQNDFKKIGAVPARNTPQSYRFVDETALANSNGGASNVHGGGVYVYRIKIIDAADKITYSNTISVTHTISSVRRTWGMIKEMFR